MAKKFVLYDDTVGVDKAHKDSFPLCQTCAAARNVKGWGLIATLEEYFMCLLLEHEFWVPVPNNDFGWLKGGRAKWHWQKEGKSNG